MHALQGQWEALLHLLLWLLHHEGGGLSLSVVKEEGSSSITAGKEESRCSISCNTQRRTMPGEQVQLQRMAAPTIAAATVSASSGRTGCQYHEGVTVCPSTYPL